MLNKLAIHGGSKTINTTFKKYNSLGEEERVAVDKVMESGVLSRFIGADSEDFFGGDNVLKFERSVASYFNVKHAISVNSWTSGLTVSLGAIGISPGDEVITTPWTMSATATAILQWNAIPVFCDIDKKTFCIDPKKIEERITHKTKAIIAVDIFGQSSDMLPIMEIANRHSLKVVSDTAQAPGAKYNEKYAGTLAHIGGFSFNYHKHIHCGEGGVIVTNDDDLAYRSKLIRNHGENVIGSKGINNIIGCNYRLGEIECAIAYEQLKKLDKIILNIQRRSERLTCGIKHIKGLRTPYIPKGNTHVYYTYPLILDLNHIKVSRGDIINALKSEGVPISGGYVNLHTLPIFQEKIAYGKDNFPWVFCNNESSVSYDVGSLPVAEDMHNNSYMSIPMTMYDFSDQDIDLIILSFKKVFSNLHTL
jgi:perosamine synthetase